MKNLSKLWSRKARRAAEVTSSISQFQHGISCFDYLQRMHEVLNPSSYLEIGVYAGAAFSLAKCPSIGIDPNLRLQGNPVQSRTETYYFQLKSDDFFAKHNLNTFFPNGVDFAFLDGMHHFEFLLRDFINTEKYSHKNTVVTLHDCYPVNAEIAEREYDLSRRTDVPTQTWWAGDVWKMLPILRDFRPDLEVAVLDCPPTGLVVVRGLDAKSQALVKAYDEIVAKYTDMTLHDYSIDKFRLDFPIADSRRVFEADSIKRFLGRA